MRGLVAIIAIVALLGFGAVVVVVGPLSEIDVTPIREYRTVGSLQDPSLTPLRTSSVEVMWNVIVVIRPMSLSGFLHL